MKAFLLCTVVIQPAQQAFFSRNLRGTLITAAIYKSHGKDYGGRGGEDRFFPPLPLSLICVKPINLSLKISY